MTTNHFDQMRAWWDEATPGIPKTGDTYIEDERHRGSSFRIVAAATDHKYGFDNIRILSRAPKPKPAWHDAVAVIAHTARFSERRPFALTHTEDVLDPYNAEWITRDDLLNPVPLIEAKVTDGMVQNALTFWEANDPEDEKWARAFITAALGLDPA